MDRDQVKVVNSTDEESDILFLHEVFDCELRLYPPSDEVVPCTRSVDHLTIEIQLTRRGLDAVNVRRIDVHWASQYSWHRAEVVIGGVIHVVSGSAVVVDVWADGDGSISRENIENGYGPLHTTTGDGCRRYTLRQSTQPLS